MKLIFDGAKLAAVILEDKEIETMRLALCDFIPRSGGPVQAEAEVLLTGLLAKAPQ